MLSNGPNEPRKGAGYFANRLKEKGIEVQEAPKDDVEPDESSKPKYGQIFEESTKSIAAMTDDMSETAKLVSSMKEGLERVSKAVNLIDVGNPLCDPFGSCSYSGVDFVPKPTPESLTLDELSASMHESGNDVHNEEQADASSEYTTDALSDLRFDANSIKDELQEFRDDIKQKETEINEFRTKLNQARLHAKEFASTDFGGLGNEVTQISDHSAHNTEFDAIDSDQFMNIDSIQNDQGSDRLSIIRQEIKAEEKRLLEIRWKTKKAEAEYEDKKAAKEELAEVGEVLEYLKPERDSLKAELGHLRSKIERLEHDYDEMNSRKRERQMEYDDLKCKFKKLESDYEDKKNSFRLH